jgi:hypothetical protein
VSPGKSAHQKSLTDRFLKIGTHFRLLFSGPYGPLRDNFHGSAPHAFKHILYIGGFNMNFNVEHCLGAVFLFKFILQKTINSNKPPYSR